MLLNEYLTEIISGFTISLLMIPEALAFSFILDLPPSTGLHSTMIMSFITALFGGCPAIISGSTAAVATSLVGVKHFFGEEYIFFTIIMGGIIQMLLGITGLYKYIYNISKPVSSGFLIALAFLIGFSQIQNFKNGDKWFESKEMAETLFFSLVSAFITLYGILIIRFSKVVDFEINIPGGLLSIILLALLFYVYPNKLDIQKVGDKGDVKNSIPTFRFPNIELTMENIIKILPFSFAMAISGLTETLFMVKDASEMVESIKKEASPLRETIVQGIANVVSGFAGGIGGCTLVGQSKYNLENGSKTRLSSICASLFFILFTLFLSNEIGNIPMPAIIGIMIVIALKTGDWNSLYKNVGEKKWLVVIVTSLVGIFSGNLALAIIIGSLVHNLL